MSWPGARFLWVTERRDVFIYGYIILKAPSHLSWKLRESGLVSTQMLERRFSEEKGREG
jgi:hypothetical protein